MRGAVCCATIMHSWGLGKPASIAELISFDTFIESKNFSYSEIAPAKNRGKLVGLYQFNLVMGILIAFLSNYLLSGIGENDWRYMMGVEAIPAIIYTLLVFSIPKSPRWLYLNNQKDKAEKIIRGVYSKNDADELIIEITRDNELSVESESIFQKKYSFILTLAFLVAAFNQFSGINAFLYLSLIHI